MDRVLKIHNPDDIPFGPLSNNALHHMNIDGKRWSTVTNYILANMLIAPIDRLTLQNSKIQGNSQKVNIEAKIRNTVANVEARQRRKISASELEGIKRTVIADVHGAKMNIHQKYNDALGREHVQTTRRAIEEAYNAKIIADPDLQRSLLETGTVHILYMSDNPLLGIGADRRGHNLIGITLMQIRHNLRIASAESGKRMKEDAVRDDVVTAYKARQILHRYVGAGVSLKEHMGKSATEIVNEYDGELGGDIANAEFQEKLYSMFQKGHYDDLKREIDNPGSLINEIHNATAGTQDRFRKDIRNRIILTTYTEYVIRDANPQMTEEKIREAAGQLLRASPSIDDYTKLRNRIVSMFDQGVLPIEITRAINEALPSVVDQISQGTSVVDSARDESSSSSDEDNVIKQAMASEDKTHQRRLIDQIQKFTGKPRRKYKGMSVEELEVKLSQYTGLEPSAVPSRKAGRWEVRVGFPNNTKQVLPWKHKHRPTTEELEEIIVAYNAQGGKQIRRTMISVRWLSEFKESENVEEAVDVVDMIEDAGYVKPTGTPIEIYADVVRNAPRFRSLSPIFQQEFEIKGFKFNYVSVYITTMLLTNEGVRDTRNAEGRSFQRGMSLSKAIDLIGAAGPDQANTIYLDQRKRGHEELLSTFTNIGLGVKFSDRNMQDLLLLTGTSELLWGDPIDLFLGAGTREMQGYNYVGRRLMHLRDEFKKARDDDVYGFRIVHNRIPFILHDPFMRAWVRMRLNDMCSTVYKVKHYLWKTDKTDQIIDARFVETVLDDMYQPCGHLSALSKTVDSFVPKEFTDLVMHCDGIGLKLQKDYVQEIKDLSDEIAQDGHRFWGTGTHKKFTTEDAIKDPDDPYAMAERQARELEAYKESWPSEGDLADFRKSQELRLTRSFSTSPAVKEESYDAKERRRWKKFNAEIFATKLTQKKIEKKTKRIIADMEEQRSNHGAFDRVVGKCRNIADTALKALHRPMMGKQERDRRIVEYTKEESARRHKYYGTTSIVVTKAEIADHEKEISEKRKRMAEFTAERKKEFAHSTLRIQEIAQVYWSRIYVLLQFLFKSHNNQPTAQDIKIAIAGAEMLNSQKTECVKVIDNDENNCIASALANLLAGLDMLKSQYGDHISLSTHDIDLVGSIILNRDLDDRQVEHAVVVDDAERDHRLQDTIFEEDGDLALEENDNDDRVIEFDEDEEYGDDGGSVGSFGMNGDLEQVKIMLNGLSVRGIDDINQLANYFMGMIITIKTYSMSQKIKQNRINFFATIR